MFVIFVVNKAVGKYEFLSAHSENLGYLIKIPILAS